MTDAATEGVKAPRDGGCSRGCATTASERHLGHAPCDVHRAVGLEARGKQVYLRSLMAFWHLALSLGGGQAT